MNVTCPNCATVFRVDPAKVPEAGVRARCSVCSAVFGVHREDRHAEPVGAAGGASRESVSADAPAAARVPPVNPTPGFHKSPAPAAPATPVAPTPPSGPTGAPAGRAAPVASPRVAPPAAAPAGPRPEPQRPVAPGAPTRPSVPPAAPRAGAATPSAAPAPAASAPAPPVAPGPSHGSPAPTRPAAPVAGRPVNPFLSQDPALKARRLARALVSDIVVYHPAKRQEGLRDGTLKELFEEEIRKSYQEYTDQVGRELAESTGYFREALNEILAGGRQIF